MGTITIRDNIARTQTALWDGLSLAFAARIPPVATLAALRTTYQRPAPGALVYVTAENRCYRWSRESSAADDGLQVIAPTPAPVCGRWLRCEHGGTYGPNWRRPLHSVQQGFCTAVEIYQGPLDADSIIGHVEGRKPSICVKWLGDTPAPKSLNRGALYRVRHEFMLIVTSECLRDPPAGVMGSGLSSEYAKDPGLYAMLDEICYVLAGLKLGQLNEIFVEFGRRDVLFELLDERLFIGTVQVFVEVGFDVPDEDLDPLAIELQPTRADSGMEPGPDFDEQNYVTRGYDVPPGPGLTRTPGPGIATVGGVVVSSTPAARTFTAQADTYRDLLPDGTLQYSEVPIGDPPPAVPAGALRIARTRTDATSIVDDRWLCGSSVLWGPPMPVPLP